MADVAINLSPTPMSPHLSAAPPGTISSTKMFPFASFAKYMPSGFFSSTAYLAHPGGTGSSSSVASAWASTRRRRRVETRRRETIEVATGDAFVTEIISAETWKGYKKEVEAQSSVTRASFVR